jgi:hypothetical protein
MSHNRLSYRDILRLRSISPKLMMSQERLIVAFGEMVAGVT